MSVPQRGSPGGRRGAARAVALLCALLAAAWTTAAGAAATPLPISQVPLSLAGSLPPNLFITIDDSGSMAWGHVPDTLYQNYATDNPPGAAQAGPGLGLTPGICQTRLCGAARGYKSSAFNGLYYDPTVTYVAPPDMLADPSGKTPLATSFAAAFLDGFNPLTSGTINLATQYRATSTYFPGSTPAKPWSPGPTAPTCPDPANFLCNDWAPHNAADLAALGVGSATAGAPAYYYTYNAGTAGCPAAPVSPADACYTLVRVDTQGAAQQQNFAVWYSFYRTRRLAIISAAALAMSDPALATSRVAWQSINTCTDFSGTRCASSYPPYVGITEPAVDNSIQRFTGAHVTDFYNFLKYLPSAGQTPMRSALERVGQALVAPLAPDGPWGLDPKHAATTSYANLSCRSNFHMLMTDGEWNGDTGAKLCGNDCGNADSSALTLPDGRAYAPGAANTTAVYGDANTDALSDIAFYYWSHDLQPTLADNVPAYTRDLTLTQYSDPYWNPKNDPATWHHLVNFTVGLGLNGSLGTDWAGSTFFGTYYNGLVAGTQAWPVINPALDLAPKVYDLWHTAIDSRGEAFSANSPQDLISAFKAFIGRAEAQSFGASAVAASSTSVQSSTVLYQASFRHDDWSGLLQALPLVCNAANTTMPCTVGTVAPGGPGWSSETFPAPAARNIVTFAGPSNAPAPIVPAPTAYPFTQAGLAAAGAWPLAGTSAATAPLVLNWLRGDQTNEQTLQNPTGTLRARRSLLGDVVGSDPVVAANDDLGYGALAPAFGGGLSYYTYLSTTKTTRKKIVYVGANDGMLHGFDADETNPDGTQNAQRGLEVLAYVPNGVLPNIAALSSPNYVHNFFVDSTPYVGDAFLGGAWHNVLVGLTGAGAKSAFALDVTIPTAFGVAPAPYQPLWEVDAAKPDGTPLDSDLGYTIGQAVVALLRDGNWYAIFGNGYNSTRQCAVLFLVQLQTGAVRKIDTSGLGAGNYATGLSGYPACPVANGLASPTLYDSQRDRVVDTIYAGDQLGNLWKFDLSSANPGSWQVASTAAPPTPLFTAFAPQALDGAPSTVPQPITSAPEIGPTVNGVGVEVYFGTGRFFLTSDPADATIQSFYGIVDPGGPSAAALTRAALQVQTITPVATATSAEGGRNVSQNPVAATASGWFMDLPDPGERVLGTPLVLGGEVLFSTLVPSVAACSGAGTSFLMAVNAFNGAGAVAGKGFFHLDTAGTTVDGILSPVGFVRSLSSISNPAGGNDVVLAGGAGGTAGYETAASPYTGRTSWQEIVP